MAATRKNENRSNFYIGEVKQQLRDGFGLYVYPNSYFRYEGDWKKGKKHGHGKLLMKDGSYYEGEFSNGEIEGNGFRYWAASGNTYSGQFSCGEQHGYGVMQYGDGGRYEGEFSYGMREGHGLLVDKEGNTYRGSFYQNKKHGDGEMTFRNADHFEGSWVLNHRQGHGSLRSANGSIYEGQWRNDLFNGQGTMIHCSGVIYEGLWISGKPANIASKIVILEGEVLEIVQGTPFTVSVQLQNEEDEVMQSENGRLLKIWAGVRYTHLSPSSNSSFLELIEDIEEQPVPTPFGYECISYPLIEASTGSTELVINVPAGGKSKSELKDSVVFKEDMDSENGVGSVGGSGDATNDLTGKQHAFLQPDESSAARLVESFPGDAWSSGLEDKNVLPPANQRVESGSATFKDIQLAIPPANYRPFMHSDDMEKKGGKKPSGRMSAEKILVSQEKIGDSRPDLSSRAGLKSKKDPAESMMVKPGEYVIMVQEVTMPPFLDQILPPAFLRLKVVPQKGKVKSSKRRS
ncbi:MORN repeat-containing protein 1 [Protopterus annectens]|uniref:MORN repeat-containing protein 1 n=1 Tax=Protopterus annectens TaxID=7888 RepID=UPI001CF9ADA5|nr:MORN repeat-containing protein 1 [Protopterus annectens]